MSLTSKLYGLRRSGISHGDVFTSPEIVAFMLDLIGYTSDTDLSSYKILEPSFGNGEFISEIQKRLVASAQIYGFDACEAMSGNVFGCEIDTAKYEKCVGMIQKEMPDYNPANLKNEDFLFSDWNVTFDFIAGNPPYVRFENIPSTARTIYKSMFRTFHYRCDLYVLFYEHSLKYLAENGKHCFICSNRWLKNEYGKKLRELVSNCYSLNYIIDIENVNAFKETVLAYPSITVISKSLSNKATKIAWVDKLCDLSGPILYTTKIITNAYDWDTVFLESETDKFNTIEQQGFIIGIGVATGADKIFISPQLKGCIEDELLIPVINAKDLTANTFNWRGQFLLNPYTPDGNIIDLNHYPKAQHYLEAHKQELERRHIVRKGRTWYALIDRVKQTLLSKPKILLPDISGNYVIFVDEGHYYPAHNIYYITGKGKEDLIVLAAILMSKFIQKQIASVSNKMSGGLPRWQSQSIKKLRIPQISDIAPDIRHKLQDAYSRLNVDEINEIMDDIISVQTTSHKVYRKKEPFQPSLFDHR